jgi:zinc protease
VFRAPTPPGLPGEACLAFRAPPPASPDHAAFLAALGKLLAAAPALGAGPFPVRFAPLDDPHAGFVCAPAAAGEPAETAVARLDAFVAAAQKTPDGRDAARASYGAFLGLLDVPDAAFAQNVYGLAFGAGRREQLGIDGAALRRAFEAASPAEQARVGEAVFGRTHRAAAVASP